MQVILIQDVNNLGGANELVTVKNGYARNYLIPSKYYLKYWLLWIMFKLRLILERNLFEFTCNVFRALSARIYNQQHHRPLFLKDRGWFR